MKTKTRQLKIESVGDYAKKQTNEQIDKAMASGARGAPDVTEQPGSHQRMVSVMECLTCKKCGGEPKPTRDERGCWQIICRGCGWATQTFHNPWIAADSWNGHHAND